MDVSRRGFLGGLLATTALAVLPVKLGVNAYPNAINVKAFGAVGDGVTDDAMSIQAAFDNAFGKPVYFPKGHYITSKELVVKNSSWVIGDGLHQSVVSLLGGRKRE